MAADAKSAIAHVQLVDGYRFTATFPGPTLAGLLAAAIGGCLSASLTLCLNKAHLDPDAVNAHVTAKIRRHPRESVTTQSRTRYLASISPAY